MKRIIWLIPLAVILFTGFIVMGNNTSNVEPAPDRSKVTRLWKDFEAAQNADRPQRMIEILQEIKDIALKERLPWDFYKAGENLVDVSSSRNWKLRDSLNTQFQKDIKAFDEPVLTFYNSRYDLSGKEEFLRKNRARLESGRNSDFYEVDEHLSSEVYCDLLPDLIANDWQYALWSLVLGNRWSRTPNTAVFTEMLEQTLNGKYPEAAFLEFTSANDPYDTFRTKERLEEYARKYNGKAVALFARQRLLEMAFSSLEEGDKGTVAEYRALRERCAAFEKDRKAFSGSEKKIADECTLVEGLIETLDGKSVWFNIEKGLLTVMLRNLDGASVTVKDKDRTVFSTRLDNPAKSYYAMDTVRLQLPALDDGYYTVVCSNGKVSSEQNYSRYGLSLAQKEDAGGYAVFLARAASGEPVRKADVAITDQNDKVVAELKDFQFKEGFTYLPKDFTEKLLKDRRRNRLICSLKDSDGTVRRTQTAGVSSYVSRPETRDEATFAAIFPDRTAFNPGETVRFKVVLYRGDRRERLQVLPDHTVTVKLFDPQYKEIKSINLRTNEFGSAAGEFVLERQERNGRFRISVEDGSNTLAGTSIQVDDFVLPSFDLAFDPDPNLYFPGDTVKVSGTLKSYSGHSLAAADIRYTVEGGGQPVRQGVLRPDAGGRFTVTFVSAQDRYLYYNVRVTVSDTTGETEEWNTGRNITRNIPFSATLENRAEADVDMMEEHEYKPDENYSLGVVSEDHIRFRINTEMYRQGVDVNRPTLKISYKLTFGGRVLAEGRTVPGDVLDLDTSGYPSGLYVFEAVASDRDVFGNDIKTTVVYDILKVKDGDTVLDAGVRNLFKATSDKDIEVQIGSTDGPVWACVELHGTGNVLLGSRLVHLEGVRGRAGSLETVRFDWPAGAPDVVSINVIYFKDYRQYRFSKQYDRTSERLKLPLSFTRFLDRTTPGTKYMFEISTLPGVECAATVFDKATERIMSNRWNGIQMLSAMGPTVYLQTTVGSDRTEHQIMVRGARNASYMSKASVGSVQMELQEEAFVPMMNDALVLDTAAAGYAGEEGMADDMGEDIAVREDFAKALAFEPFLRSDARGLIDFPFTTSDQLSTFLVQLFAHDKDMSNAVLRQEMVVSIPAKVSLVEPKFLYAGDRYAVKASLSSSIDKALTGKLRIDLYDGAEYRDTAPVSSTVKEVTLGPGAALSEELEIAVPDIKDLGIKLTFIADDREYGSDAVFVTVPVYKAVQTLTEAHSSILHSGESMEELLEGLRRQFVNVSGEDAAMKNVSLLQMVKEALPTKVEPASDNVLDLSEALYVRQIAAKLGAQQTASKTDAEILAKLLACRNEDGGFGWFKDMDSSPVLTAVLLERLASLRAHGIGAGNIPSETVEAAVLYLDKSFFEKAKRPIWCGGLSEEQYVSVRVLYPQVEFPSKDIDKKVLKEFKKRMKAYLTPRKERGLNGYVLGKARRMRTLLSLSGSDAGRSLAAAWGIRLATGSKLRSSLVKDLASLQEYAVGHPSGGWYYPNAVMPYRGLLESEAYAHAFIADLLRSCAGSLNANTDVSEALRIADGISLWLMIQKESQHWEEDAAFVDAISSILDASQETLDTRIISLTKTFTKPFDEVKTAGNGFTVERRFFVERTVDGKLQRMDIAEGDTLTIGDKVTAEYRIWNEENRSFIKLTAPRPASLRPADQLSGHFGWWLRPISVAGWRAFSPSGYRSVLAAATEYWFNAYPEENTVVTEEFFVTQSGCFQMPAVSIESLYAPHYRANGSATAPLLSR